LEKIKGLADAKINVEATKISTQYKQKEKFNKSQHQSPAQ